MKNKAIKTHKCSEHWARSYDAQQWSALPLVGWMPDGAGGWLELRNCNCKSSIAIELTETEMRERQAQFGGRAANDTQEGARA